jgi:hypothetical protein
MRTFFVLIALVFVLGINSQAQTAPDTTLVIAFTETIHDYGTIALKGDGSCEFKFTNKGNSPLILSNVAASCGCTVPSWTREPVLPGNEGSIKVTYNTAIAGNFTKSITVTSNAKNSPVILVIKGVVVAVQ